MKDNSSSRAWPKTDGGFDCCVCSTCNPCILVLFHGHIVLREGGREEGEVVRERQREGEREREREREGDDRFHMTIHTHHAHTHTHSTA